MIGSRWRQRGRLYGGEEGQALVLWTLCLFVIIGMAGLVIDGSNYQNTKRQLQNAADAAAFAGAEDLPGCAAPATAAAQDAVTWAGKNPPAGGAVVPTVTTTSQNTPCDTLKVTVSKTPSLFLMGVLGVTPKTISAVAAVQVLVQQNTVESCTLSSNNCPAYAIWYMDNNLGASGCRAVQFGDVVTWIGTQPSWIAENVCDMGQPGSAWTGGSGDFKGFFHNPISGPCNTGVIECTGEVVSAGGNSCTTQYPYLLAAETAWEQHTPFIVAMLNHETGNGSNIDVTIETFVALNLNISQNAAQFPLPLSPTNQKCSYTLFGQVESFSGAPPGFQIGGGTPPPPGGACGTGVGICVTTSQPKLIQ